MRALALTLLILALPAPAAPAPAPADSAPELPLMPWPAKLEQRAGVLDLSRGVKLELVDPDGRPTHELRRALKRLGLARHPDGIPLRLDVDGPAKAPHPRLDDDEGYLLTVSREGVVLRAREPAGALRGLATLEQLVVAAPAQQRAPYVAIDDQPRFPWRGLLLDVARHALTKDDVIRTLQGMAAAKLNVLHLHLTDNQAFRLCVPELPELCKRNPDGHHLDAAALGAIVTAARELSIRVVPEVDVPGHTASWFLAHPELSAAPLDGPRAPPTSLRPMDDTLDPTKPETLRALQLVFAEVRRRFPDDFVHLGGDEVNGKQWRENPKIRAFMRANGLEDTAALQAHFLARVVRLPALRGKTLIGWDEVLDGDTPPGTVGQAWRGPEGLQKATARGHRAIFSYGLYLDLGHSAAQHYEWRLPELRPEQRARVLGGEAAMWTELVDGALLDGRVFPRALAIAERLWSPATVRDEAKMYARLRPAAAKLAARGLRLDARRREIARGLVGVARADDLLLVARLFRPVQGYLRHMARHYHQDTPLDRFVDLSTPDPIPPPDLDAVRDACLRLEKELSAWPTPPDARAVDRAETLAVVRAARVAVEAVRSDSLSLDARRRALARALAPVGEVELADARLKLPEG